MLGIEIDGQDDPLMGVFVDTIDARLLACLQTYKNEILLLPLILFQMARELSLKLQGFDLPSFVRDPTMLGLACWSKSAL
nr:hypothetical protein [Tanacetum cinerariifolium]